MFSMKGEDLESVAKIVSSTSVIFVSKSRRFDETCVYSLANFLGSGSIERKDLSSRTK